ncbi:hypothetical protein ANN_12636 [Periplaneta americana]|uniref:Uncharacterized protein n=1 Tax=Periplaneta americana TaxID=6978 RepID=A0ABQ8TJU1_PERAM|nr:hypothetical protein ANN_12636 [Periplaneta americana]
MASLCEGGSELPGSLKAIRILQNIIPKLITEWNYAKYIVIKKRAKTALLLQRAVQKQYHRTPVVEGGSKRCFRYSAVNPKFAYENMLQIIELLRITFQHKVRNCSYVTLTLHIKHSVVRRNTVVCNLKIDHSPAIYPQYAELESCKRNYIKVNDICVSEKSILSRLRTSHNLLDIAQGSVTSSMSKTRPVIYTVLTSNVQSGLSANDDSGYNCSANDRSGLSANDDSGYNCSANDRFLWPSKVNVNICSSEKINTFASAHISQHTGHWPRKMSKKNGKENIRNKPEGQDQKRRSTATKRRRGRGHTS